MTLTPNDLTRSLSGYIEFRKPSSIIVTNGCFDLLHSSHISFLTEARRLGGPNPLVIVGINSDEAVRELKGETRPIIPQDQRLFSISSLKSVNFAFIFEGVDFAPYLKEIPNCIYVKGEDYTSITKEEQNALSINGGSWKNVRSVFKEPTSKIIERIKNSH